MIILLAVMVWCAIAWVAWVVFTVDPSARLHGKGKRWIYLAVSLVLLVLFLRPEEEIEIGEDPGVYFNSAASLVHHGAFHFPDPALSRLPPAERLLFRYGNADFMVTKDNALWAKDHDMEEVGNFFMVGYPLLLGLPIALGIPYGVFWVTPLLGVLCAWVMFRLGNMLAGRKCAGWAALALLTLNPVFFWNVRSLRAEMPASFLVLAGMFLWLRGWPSSEHRRYQAFVAGFALSLAPLFHVTALYVLLPAIVLAVWMASNTAFWRYWWLGVASGMAAFAGHLIWISDPYWILQNLLAPGRRWPFVAIAVGGILLVRMVKWGWVRGLARFRFNAHTCGRYVFVGLALVVCVVVLYAIRFRRPDGLLPGLPAWSAAYVSLTDFKSVYRLLSRVFVFCGVIGLVPLCFRAGVEGDKNRAFFWLLVPAALTIGWTNHFMFETRRMVPFLLPLLVAGIVCLLHAVSLALAWLIRRLGVRGLPWFQPAFFAVLVAAILLAGYRGRSHLYTTWNYAGAFRLYRKIARDVARQGDVLFAEYTQTAAPVERLAQVPLLPIAWGYRSEAQYREIENIYRRFVQQHPDERVLFLTPFSGAALPGLALEPLDAYVLDSQRVDRSKRSVPPGVHDFQRTMRLYRVHASAPNDALAPYMRRMDGSLLGLRGTAKTMHNRSIDIDAVPLHDAGLLPVRQDSVHSFFVFASSDGAFDVDIGGVKAADDVMKWNLGTWLIVRIHHPDGGASPVTARAQGKVFLVDGFGVNSAGEVVRLDLPDRQTVRLSGVDSQWVRSQAGIALPVPRQTEHGRYLFVAATTGRKDHENVAFRLSGHDFQAEVSTTTGWKWYMIPFTAQADKGVFRWFDVETIPSWNPDVRGFPDDLGMRIGAVAVFTVPARE